MSRALVAEPSVPVSNALRRFLEVYGYSVTVVHFADDAVLQLRKFDPHVVFASVSLAFDGESLCAKLKKLKPHVPVVLSYQPEEEKMIERATKAGADAWLVAPPKGAQVVSLAQAMVRQRELEERVETMQAELHQTQGALAAQMAKTAEALETVDLARRSLDAKAAQAKVAKVAPPPQVPVAKAGENTTELGFFKRFLTMEVKRSARYKYPLAFLMIALDDLDERRPQKHAAIRAEAIAAVSALLRDIDLCVPFSEERLLVFLPHTPRDGASTVASRIVARLAKLHAFEGGTASVGLATFDAKVTPKATVGFGPLMREASLNLRLAQDGGGNRVESTPQLGQRKRDRITLA